VILTFDFTPNIVDFSSSHSSLLFLFSKIVRQWLSHDLSLLAFFLISGLGVPPSIAPFGGSSPYVDFFLFISNAEPLLPQFDSPPCNPKKRLLYFFLCHFVFSFFLSNVVEQTR